MSTKDLDVLADSSDTGEEGINTRDYLFNEVRLKEGSLGEESDAEEGSDTELDETENEEASSPPGKRVLRSHKEVSQHSLSESEAPVLWVACTDVDGVSDHEVLGSS